ncbi:hypothetical protein BS17DRAFT_855358 [Gyrodon lividus]|nr:hypothetical protein BS17DRAFT_855358 [Gyrodon lividus]
MAKKLLKQMLLAINMIETEWGSTVIACTTDASGESESPTPPLGDVAISGCPGLPCSSVEPHHW